MEAIFQSLGTSPSERKRCSADNVPWLLHSDWRGGQDQLAPQMAGESVKMVSLALRERVQQRSVEQIWIVFNGTYYCGTRSKTDWQVYHRVDVGWLVLRRAVGKFKVHFSPSKRGHEDVYGKDQSKGRACRSGGSSPSGLQCRSALTERSACVQRPRGSKLGQKVQSGVSVSSPSGFQCRAAPTERHPPTLSLLLTTFFSMRERKKVKVCSPKKLVCSSLPLFLLVCRTPSTQEGSKWIDRVVNKCRVANFVSKYLPRHFARRLGVDL